MYQCQTDHASWSRYRACDGTTQIYASLHLTLMTAPNTLATPEGDNEQLPDAPLNPNEPAPERPPGDEPHTELPLRDALEP